MCFKSDTVCTKHFLSFVSRCVVLTVEPLLVNSPIKDNAQGPKLKLNLFIAETSLFRSLQQVIRKCPHQDLFSNAYEGRTFFTYCNVIEQLESHHDAVKISPFRQQV